MFKGQNVYHVVGCLQTPDNETTFYDLSTSCQTVYQIAHGNQLLKLTWTVIYYCKRQPYFFLSSLYLKQGIDSVYVMVGFISNDKLEV